MHVLGSVGNGNTCAFSCSKIGDFSLVIGALSFLPFLALLASLACNFLPLLKKVN